MDTQLTFQVIHSRRLRVARFYFTAPTMKAAIRHVEQVLNKPLPVTMIVLPVF